MGILKNSMVIKIFSKSRIVTFIIISIAFVCFVDKKGVSEMNEGVNYNNISREKVIDDFERSYVEWQSYQKKPNIIISSRSKDHINCKPFKDIVKLGKLILPQIFEKIENGKKSGWKESQFFLWYAVRDITGVNLVKKQEKLSEQHIAERYLSWWKENKNK